MPELAKIYPDDIATFLPDLPPEEYELRAKLRSYRNAATAMVHNTESSNARALAWMVIEYVTEAIYAPSFTSVLPELGRLCNRLMLTAMQIEEIET